MAFVRYLKIACQIYHCDSKCTLPLKTVRGWGGVKEAQGMMKEYNKRGSV